MVLQGLSVLGRKNVIFQSINPIQMSTPNKVLIQCYRLPAGDKDHRKPRVSTVFVKFKEQ